MGTANPVMMRDKDFGVVRLRAFGTYDFRIVDAPRFLREVAGTDQNFRLDEFADTMRSRIVSVFTDALATANVPALDVASRYSEMGDALLPIINPAMAAKYGLEVTSFVLENVSVPPEVEQAIDKRSSMGVIGNLNDYVKYQMGQAMGAGGEGAAAATVPAQMAMGFGMAQEMMKSMQSPALGRSERARRGAGAGRADAGTGGAGPGRIGRGRDGLDQRRGAQGAQDRQRLAHCEVGVGRLPAGRMSEAAPPVTVGKHPCPECGGDLQWHAGKQALACPYCGTVVPWTPTQAADPGAMIEEHDLIMRWLRRHRAAAGARNDTR
jgi:membrane protease subunit (stomatin/prohibitin family)